MDGFTLAKRAKVAGENRAAILTKGKTQHEFRLEISWRINVDFSGRQEA